MNAAATFVADRRRLTSASGDSLIRWALKADAVVTSVTGVAYLAAGHGLDSLLGLSATGLRGVGGFLVVYAAIVWFVATRRTLAVPAIWAVIAANAVWAIASVALVTAAWSSPSTAGNVWILLQAMAVAGFALLQSWALSRRP